MSGVDTEILDAVSISVQRRWDRIVTNATSGWLSIEDPQLRYQRAKREHQGLEEQWEELRLRHIRLLQLLYSRLLI